MRRSCKKIISVISAVILIVCMIPPVIGSAYIDPYPNTHRNTGRNIADIISVAKTQIGYTELSTTTGMPLGPGQGKGYTKYGAYFGDQTGDWCAYFVSWCASQAGISTSIVPRLGNCAALVRWYTSHSEYYTRSSGYVPKAGDMVFFNWNGGSTAKHIGIVTGVSADSVFTIEGNTDTSGYRCNAKTRSRNAAYVLGYGVPAYNDADSYTGSYAFSAVPASSGSTAYSTTKLSVITTSASDITDSNAVLNGSVVNNGRLYISSAGFLFGRDKNAMEKISQNVATSRTSLVLTMNLNEESKKLEPSTTYYYRTFARIDGRDYLGPIYAVVTIDDKPQQLMLSETDFSVGLGQTARIMAVQLPLDSKNKGITWTSSDEAVATVDNNGVVTGHAYGKATLTATTNYGSVSSSCEVTVKIASPGNIRIENTAEDVITLSWDAVDGAKGYSIYKAFSSDGEFKECELLKSRATSFSDKDLVPGNKYYYRIVTRAKDEMYDSEMSDTFYAPARLPAPESIAASSCSDSSLRISWSRVEGAVRYIVYRSRSEGGLYTIVSKTDATELTDASVIIGETYYYKVIACDNKNRALSDYSAKASATSKLGNMGIILPIGAKEPEIPADAVKTEKRGTFVDSGINIKNRNADFSAVM